MNDTDFSTYVHLDLLQITGICDSIVKIIYAIG